jgi:hypothetical protein
MGSYGLPALQVRPPEQPDLLGNLSKIAQLRQMQQQGQMGQIQLQQAQQQQSEDQAFHQTMQKYGGDIQKALPELMQVAPSHGMKVQQQLMEWQKASTEEKAKKVETSLKQMQGLGQLASTVKDPQSYQAAITQAMQGGLLDQQTGQSLLSQGYDPNTVEQMKQQAVSVQQQLENKQKELTLQLEKEKQAQTEKHQTAQEQHQTAQEQIAIRGQNMETARSKYTQSQENARQKFQQSQENMRSANTQAQENYRATAKADKPTADEKKRADLGQNLNENLDQLEEIVNRRPDLFGPAAGRLTKAREWLGTSDPDIGALQTIEHQLGMVQQSTHGMRSAIGVQTAANSLVNNFKNSPEAMKASIQAARKSAATFLGNANPGTSGTPEPVKGGARDLGAAPAGKGEGATGTLPDGTKVVIKGGRIVTQ